MVYTLTIDSNKLSIISRLEAVIKNKIHFINPFNFFKIKMDTLIQEAKIIIIDFDMDEMGDLINKIRAKINEVIPILCIYTNISKEQLFYFHDKTDIYFKSSAELKKQTHRCFTFIQKLIDNYESKMLTQNITAGLEKKLIYEYNKFKNLTALLNIGIVILKKDPNKPHFIFSEINAQLNYLFGYNFSRYLNSNIKDLIVLEKKVEVQDFIKSINIDFNAIKKTQIQIIKLKQQKKTIKQAFSAMYGKENHLIGYLIIYIDITPRI